MKDAVEGTREDGSIWFASEMKALQEHCDHFELFPTGHYMVGKSLGRFKIFGLGLGILYAYSIWLSQFKSEKTAE